MSFGKFASTFALVGAVLYVSGCSPDCRLLCEEQEEADCFAHPDDEVDCERYCKHTQDLVTNADCQVDWDVYVLCLDDIEDVCDAYPEPCLPDEDCDDPKCDNEAEELFECLADYCEDNPRNNECVAMSGGTPTGG